MKKRSKRCRGREGGLEGWARPEWILKHYIISTRTELLWKQASL
jgi:hypothetical protein